MSSHFLEGPQPVEDDSKKTKRRRRASATTTPTATPGGITQNPDPSPNKGKPTSRAESKLTAQIQISERILLEVKQFMENLRCDATLQALKVKQLTSLQEKIKSRLSPSLVAMYSANYEAGAENNDAKGMDILEQLRVAQRVLEGIQMPSLCRPSFQNWRCNVTRTS